MKKNYFMLAAATMMFAACAETDLVNEVNEATDQQVIGFETFADKVTRNSTETDLEDYHLTFGVWTYKTPAGSVEATVMDNYRVACTNSNWLYSNYNNQSLKYWDKLASYEFFAYAPYDDGVTIENDVITIPQGEYAANQNLQATLSTSLNTNVFTTSTDWMIADEVDRVAQSNDLVTLNFKHTMSKIIVKLKSTVANTKINSVSINNVYGTGSYEHPTWTTVGDAKSITGSVETLTAANTEYYTMEYLLIPSTAAPTFSINYTINDDTYNVTNAKITGIDEFENNTCYTLTATIGLAPIVFDATAEDFVRKDQSGNEIGGSVTIE